MKWVVFLRLIRVFVLAILGLVLVGCEVLEPGEQEKVDTLVETYTDAFKERAVVQFGDVEVYDIDGELRNIDDSLTFPGFVKVAGDNLTGVIHLKDSEAESIRARYIVKDDTIVSNINSSKIKKSLMDDFDEIGLRVLMADIVNAKGESHLVSDDVLTYDTLVESGYPVNVKIVTDSDLSLFTVEDFNKIFNLMIESEVLDSYFQIEIAQVNRSNMENATDLMTHWRNNGLEFSKHSSVLYKGDYVKGDPRLSQYGVVATMVLDKARDGSIEYTDANSVRTKTYVRPFADGSHTQEVPLVEDDEE